MSMDYANATINNVPSVGIAGTPAVQPPIGSATLGAANPAMWNGHIGAAQASVGPIPNPLNIQGNFIAAAGTLGRSRLNELMTWCSVAGPTTVGQTGTISGGKVFTGGAGTAVAQGAAAAGGFCWVKN